MYRDIYTKYIYITLFSHIFPFFSRGFNRRSCSQGNAVLKPTQNQSIFLCLYFIFLTLRQYYSSNFLSSIIEQTGLSYEMICAHSLKYAIESPKWMFFQCLLWDKSVAMHTEAEIRINAIKSLICDIVLEDDLCRTQVHETKVNFFHF